MYSIKQQHPDFSLFSDKFKYQIPLTQSLIYSEWNQLSGIHSDVFTIFENENQIGFFYIYKYKILGFDMGYIPYGPLLIKKDKKLLDQIKNFLTEYGKLKNLVFIRIQSYTEDEINFENTSKDIIRINKIFLGKSFTQPKQELYLDITPNIQEIYNNMHKNTRYSIRNSYNRGIKVETIELNKIEYFDDFWALMLENSKRSGYTPRPKKYIKNVFLASERNKEVKSWLAISKYKNETLAYLFIICFDKVAHYLYGCSSNKEKNRFPVYAALWESIQKSKNLECKYFNFGVVSTNDVSNSKIKTLSNFKIKFGGEIINHNKIYEIILNKKIYESLVLIKKIKNLLFDYI